MPSNNSANNNPSSQSSIRRAWGLNLRNFREVDLLNRRDRDVWYEAFDINRDGRIDRSDDLNADGIINNDDYQRQQIRSTARIEREAAEAKAELEALIEAEEQRRREEEQRRREEVGANSIRRTTAMLEDTNTSVEESILNVTEAIGAATTIQSDAASQFKFADNEAVTSDEGRLVIDSGFDIVRALNESSMSFLRPEIIAKISLLPFVSNVNSNLLDLHDLKIFERYIALESLDKDWQQVSSLMQPDIKQSILVSKSAANANMISDIEFYSNLNDMMNTIVKLLDIKNQSRQTTEHAKLFLQNFVENREQSLFPNPDSLEEFLEFSCGLISSNYFSNTKLVHSLIREFANSIIRHHPKLLSNSTRMDRYSVKFNSYMPEGAYTHDLSIKALGTRDITSTVYADGSISANILNRRCLDATYTNALPGITQLDRSRDRLKILACLLHNELSVSAGIGKLIGTVIGNKFNIAGNDPIETVLGGFFKNEGNVLLGTGSPMSYADFLVLNESSESLGSESVKILPFEVSAIVSNGKNYLPGSKYFVHLPVQKGLPATPLAQFAKKFEDLNVDAQDALRKLLSFDSECKFTPADIVIRCLKDVRKSLDVLLDDSSSLNKSLTAAFLSKLRWNSRRSNTSIVNTQGTPGVSALDLLFISCANKRDVSDKNASHVPNFSFPVFAAGSRIDDFVIESKISSQEGLTGNYIERLNSILFELGQGDVASIFPSPQDDFEKANFFGYEKTILDDIIANLRSIQQEAFNAGNYLDNDKFTRYNRWDDNTLLACMFEITRCLMKELIRIDDLSVRFDGRDGSKYRVQITDVNKVDLIKLRDFLDIVITTFESGIDLNSIFANQLSSPVAGVFSSTRFKEGGLSAGDLIDIINSLIDHRKFFKMCLGYLDGFAQNIIEANVKMTEFFQRKNSNESTFAERFQRLYQDENGRMSIEMITKEQNSLRTAYSLASQPMQRPSKIKKSTINTKMEDDIQEFFIKNISNLVENDDLAIIFGLPAGLLNGLRQKKFVEEATRDNAVPRLTADSQQDTKIFSLDICKINELYPERGIAETSVKFDSELFILPGDLSFNTNALTGDIIESLMSVIEGTTFTRIVNGKIEERLKGYEMVAAAANEDDLLLTLQNHVIDRIYKNFINSTLGICIEDHLWFANNALSEILIDDVTFDNLQKLLLDSSISSTLKLSVDSLVAMFENAGVNSPAGIRRLKSPQLLNEIIKRNQLSKKDVETLVKILSNTDLSSQVEVQKIISPRLFDRIFAVLFTKNPILQNRVNFLRSFPEDESYATEIYSMSGYAYRITNIS